MHVLFLLDSIGAADREEISSVYFQIVAAFMGRSASFLNFAKPALDWRPDPCL
jgi:hypothetical protein